MITKKLKTKIEVIIVIICLCYHFWELIIVYYLLNMAKHFIWLEETGKHIKEFEIGYMINPHLHVNKTFK